MCFGWKFKLETFWGPQCWVEETGLGLDGCTGLSVMAQERSWSEWESTPRKWWALNEHWWGRWVGPHFQGHQNMTLFEMLIHSPYGKRRNVEIDHCAWCSPRQKWDGRPTGIWGVNLSQQFIQTWAPIYPVLSGVFPHFQHELKGIEGVGEAIQGSRVRVEPGLRMVSNTCNICSWL